MHLPFRCQSVANKRIGIIKNSLGCFRQVAQLGCADGGFNLDPTHNATYDIRQRAPGTGRRRGRDSDTLNRRAWHWETRHRSPHATSNTTDATERNATDGYKARRHRKTLGTYALVPEPRYDAVDKLARVCTLPFWGSSPARRRNFSRQTARFRFWNPPFSALLGVCNADATGDATDATGTQRLPGPIRGPTRPGS